MPEQGFTPYWASPPGDTIADLLEARNLSTRDFATRVGRSYKQIEQLISGRDEITAEIAKRLQSVLGLSASFWLARQSQYRADLTRLKLESRHVLSAWLRELPVKDMIHSGWLDVALATSDPAQACLKFFDVANVAVWRKAYAKLFEAAAFRTSPTFASDEGAVAAWLRRGEIESESIPCAGWNADKFRDTISGLRSLSRQKNPTVFVPELQKFCAQCGVAVVVIRAPQGCRASGATYFLSPEKAVILLSFRYLSDDHFWFSFFHEAGHLLLHEHTLFLEGEGVADTVEERDANAFAAGTLIPKEFQPSLLRLSANSYDVIRFARSVGVSPGIIVGQLQHIGRLRRNQLNTLKRRYKWTAD